MHIKRLHVARQARGYTYSCPRALDAVHDCVEVTVNDHCDRSTDRLILMKAVLVKERIILTRWRAEEWVCKLSLLGPTDGKSMSYLPLFADGTRPSPDVKENGTIMHT